MGTTIIRAVIDPELKKEASKVLKECGLTMSEAVRLLMTRVVKERGLPFELYRPNEATLEALDELDRGEGERFSDVDEVLRDLNRS